MKVTKQFETPKPPLATGVTIEMDMREAKSVLWDLDALQGRIVGEGFPKLRAVLSKVLWEGLNEASA